MRAFAAKMLAQIALLRIAARGDRGRGSLIA
jgi:hypothetical protein